MVKANCSCFYRSVIVIYSNCRPYLCSLCIWSAVTAGLWVFLEREMEGGRKEGREGESVSFPRLEIWAEGLRSDPV